MARSGRPKRPSLFVLGHQKSGTTAIAALLGAAAGVEVVLDLRQEIKDQLIPEIQREKVDFARLLRRNRSDFRSTIVKHPNLVLVYDRLRDSFPDAHCLFVIRDPRETIRSVLDRLSLPGHQRDLTPRQLETMPAPWRSIIAGQGLDPREARGLDHVQALAERWNLFADCYLTNASEMSLLRYEDFLKDKQRTIYETASSLGLPAVNEISELVDHEFQPRGVSRGIRPVDFFSATSLADVEQRCRDRMTVFGYS